ncbi:hypothetical protein RRG08_054411, partial [Elysia crispata]
YLLRYEFLHAGLTCTTYQWISPISRYSSSYTRVSPCWVWLAPQTQWISPISRYSICYTPSFLHAVSDLHPYQWISPISRYICATLRVSVLGLTCTTYQWISPISRYSICYTREFLHAVSDLHHLPLDLSHITLQYLLHSSFSMLESDLHHLAVDLSHITLQYLLHSEFLHAGSDLHLAVDLSITLPSFGSHSGDYPVLHRHGYFWNTAITVDLLGEVDVPKYMRE